MPLLFLLIVGLILGLLLTGVLVYYSTRGVIQLARALQKPALPRSVMRSLEESRRYGRLIMETAQQYPAGPIRDRLELMIRPVDEWLTRLKKLEQGLEKLYGQRNLTRELRQTVYDIEELQRQLLTAANLEADHLQALLSSKQTHYTALTELKVFQNQAELKIRKIASDLGATHAEMLLVSARGDFNDNRLYRLEENLQEQMTGLRDVLAAMDEMSYRSVIN
jgi:hypothetical protein